MAAIHCATIYGDFNPAPPHLTITISGNYSELDVRAVLLAAGWDGVTIITADIIIPASVIIFANSTGVYALTCTNSIPAGCVITIYNYGRIIGKGGNGGSHYLSGGVINKVSPTAGGPALFANKAFTLHNHGIIGGGGGGGGCGGGYDNYPFTDLGAGGGGGANYGAGGISVGGSYSGGTAVPGGNGANGDFYSPGAGGPGVVRNNRIDSGAGGYGGSYGAAGSTGQAVLAGLVGTVLPPQAGAAGGAAIVGIGYITLAVTGTILGATS